MIRRLWVIKKDSWKKIQHARHTIQEIKVLFKKLKLEKYDLVIDLQGLLRSGVITAATGSPVRIGFTEAREGSRVFYTHTVEGGKNIHAVDRYLKIAQFLGCDISEIVFPFPGLQSPSSFIPHPSSLHSPEGYAVIVPGARWKTKRWPAEKFGKLESLLSINSIIAGSKSDKDIADHIVAHSKGVGWGGEPPLEDGRSSCSGFDGQHDVLWLGPRSTRNLNILAVLECIVDDESKLRSFLAIPLKCRRSQHVRDLCSNLVNVLQGAMYAWDEQSCSIVSAVVVFCAAAGNCRWPGNGPITGEVFAVDLVQELEVPALESS